MTQEKITYHTNSTISADKKKLAEERKKNRQNFVNCELTLVINNKVNCVMSICSIIGPKMHVLNQLLLIRISLCSYSILFLKFVYSNCAVEACKI